MESLSYADMTLVPVTARVLNRNGYGHYSHGFRPDQHADDDLRHDLGDPQEEMLRQALRLLAESTARK